ncbi:ribosomal protein L13e, putative [Trichomonas vaginalis G3]|uniref:Ribosomal protein L13e, putative n=1 Tax=Trichomonas vaginalis (strain ATCC PRA-98 / G3) TaxID=412133 RepID=A2D8Z0_TRIV3|nr:structural constituent of ribosome [Trichomonas vaginalis G3]EAY23016.1 ribosomal protein L13e, putative [Trichomonas vaginalis G3]KAI5518980.1 structural constituent of ribosome [Trichomonas vaginalis G3]|eukprot:XP_001584002.1 ribosomal protein L13e [Trichomonas vaginalis G3]
MVAKNNQIPNDHLRKYWYHRVKTYFDDPARAQRRRNARNLKAKNIAPRPAEGPLRPVVRCPTVRYNMKVRLGRGFTPKELVAAGFDPALARFQGIAVDTRRAHSKDAMVKQNVERLVAYKSRLIKVKKGETAEQVNDAALFALPKAQNEIKFRVIKAEEAKKDLFKEKTDKLKAFREAKKEKAAAKHKK